MKSFNIDAVTSASACKQRELAPREPGFPQHVPSSLAGRSAAPELPRDIVEKIMVFLGPEGATRTAAVNRTWAEAARSPQLWARFAEHAPLPAPPMTRAAPAPVAWAPQPAAARCNTGKICFPIMTVISVAQFATCMSFVNHLAGKAANERTACLQTYCATANFYDPPYNCVDYFQSWIHQNPLPTWLPGQVQHCAYVGVNSLAVLLLIGGAVSSVLTGPLAALLITCTGLRLYNGVAAAAHRWKSRRDAQGEAVQPEPASDRAAAPADTPRSRKRFTMRMLNEQKSLLRDLEEAVRASDIGTVRDVLVRKPWFDPGLTPAILDTAVEAGNTHIVSALLHAGHPVAERQITAAVQASQPDILAELLSYLPEGRTAAYVSNEAFLDAALLPESEILARLIGALGPAAERFINAPLGNRGASPFFLSAQHNDAGKFDLMLHNGGDLRGCVRERGISVEQMARQSDELSAMLDAYAPGVRIYMG